MGALPGILLLIIGLLVSVGLHELGHLVPAKKFGVKVSQYFIGFGPTLWSVTRGGTEYGIKAIPLGGYVALAGMLAPAKAGTPTHKNGQLTMAEEARRASAAELEPGEEDQAFWRLPAWQKLVVMCGGPVMNLVLAAVLLAVVFVGIGTPQLTNTVGAITPCVNAEASSTPSDGTCDADNPPSPASRSDLQLGDSIVTWGGIPTTNWHELSAAIASGGSDPVIAEVVRDGRQIDVVIEPVTVTKPVLDAGQPVYDDAGDPLTHDVPYVGISPASQRERQPITAVPGATWDFAVGTGKVVLALPVHLWNTLTDLITGAERDHTGVIGIVGVADIAGNITATDNATYGLTDRAGDLLLLLVGLNMSLFVFNMIPLLPLDGGHILGALIEGTRRQIARMRGTADPGPFDTARLLPLSQVVIIALIAMTVLLVVADIANPIR
ncbi:M50 family metallopeptidase [Trueperella bialowiezensis]|uniref:Metalloprotease mmpA n=1 Tax=Trueperella bialowiezensis TaxID=312285 RepID=A0A448PCL1_9ACTO|nr:site-2 protease family protein [Trueperella bialowiezensis]VEI12668.1 Metalloprotease mmpA [Trueperella bialowiezensis]